MSGATGSKSLKTIQNALSSEIIIKYVATHCRLAQKEHQRNCLIDEYLQNVSDLEQLCEKPATVRNDLKKTTSLPDEQR